MAVIYPSLISADILNLEHVITTLDPYVHGYHLDIMDAHFVPNLTWGPQFMHAIARITSQQLWVHLMVTDPLKWCTMLTLPANSIISFHIELEKNNLEIIKRVREKKWTASIAINPKTDVEKIFPLLADISHVLVMSVEPGYSGQQFLPVAVEKLQALAEYRQKSGINFIIGVDGGVNHTNIKDLVIKGADHLAIAAGIFNDKNPVENIKNLYAQITS